MIDSDHIPSLVHLAQQYIEPSDVASSSQSAPSERTVDLAAGILTHVTQGLGWDVPEAWYFLAKAYKLQGRRDRERECLSYALSLSETRGVREVTTAVGWCL